MSFLSWLFPGKPQRARQSTPESSGLSRAEATRPTSSDKNGPVAPGSDGNAHAANRKNERMARREMLYNVVRESMVRAGVLSASYKFKVLSLDARGRQFLVMMDLAREFGGQTEGLAEIEALIAQSAKARYDILVSAVYWRVNEHVAVGQLRSQTPAVRISSPVPLDSKPLPLETAPVAPVAVESASSSDATVALGTRSPEVAAAIAAAVASAPVTAAPAVEPPRSLPRFQPIEADEVAAFKKALAAGVTAPAKVAAAAVAATAAASVVGLAAARTSGPRNITLLTGYEETEMPDPDTPMPALSGTQYGDLM